MTIQKVIRLALSNDGYEIQTVSDGNEAIQQISLFQPDVVLIDTALPGKSALQVKHEVEGSLLGSPIRFILMSSAFEKLADGDVSQFDAQLTKPFDPAHLRQVIQQVLGSQASAPSSSVSSKKIPPKPGAFTAPPPIPTPTPLGEMTHDFEPLRPTPGPTPLDVPFPQTDIQELTESTIRMSGLDDFEWNVSDEAHRKIEPEESLYRPDPTLQPPSSFDEPAEPAFNFTNTDHDATPPQAPPQAHDLMDQQQIEEMVERQIRESVEKIAQKTLADVAERVIKQEIRKILEQF